MLLIGNVRNHVDLALSLRNTTVYLRNDEKAKERFR
jgi:hypothetical protein